MVPQSEINTGLAGLHFPLRPLQLPETPPFLGLRLSSSVFKADNVTSLWSCQEGASALKDLCGQRGPSQTLRWPFTSVPPAESLCCEAVCSQAPGVGCECRGAAAPSPRPVSCHLPHTLAPRSASSSTRASPFHRLDLAFGKGG